ncbi:MAG: bifunctional hydroxymethylpyrimidine kinase/phosphomethylpyrimidine kinase, partial [Rickettsiales bacterium]|nr:bifunctional hydroxymethylpyrimidine kinase/phosphomethylpyrimidine kinase [Rickettsiales bacterium]
MPSKVMIIAGSDSGAGAGIQGDLKTCMALGAYASTVITAITAQNTLGVEAIFEIPTEHIEKQIHAVLRDIGADVIKTGMLSSSAIVDTVVETLDAYSQDASKKLVVDPVMVAKGGARLLQQRAVDKVIERLLPKAYLVTPNIPEAALLSGMTIETTDDMI